MITLLYIILILALFAAMSALAREALLWYDRYKIRKHIQAVDARVKRQAIAAGVWDKMPIVLGGRALDLKAKENFGMEREPGETDAELRRRYMQLYETPLCEILQQGDKRK